MAKLSIRKARKKDLSEIQRLATTFYIEEGKHDSTLMMDYPRSTKAKRLYQRFLDSPKKVIFLAEDNGPIGYIAGFLNDFDGVREHLGCNIFELFIEKSYRRKNMGSQLVLELRKWAQSKGAEDLRVAMYSNNKRAEKFYTKHGFKPFGVTMLKEKL